MLNQDQRNEAGAAEPTGRAKGGVARAAKLTKEQRSEIARKGALARKAKVLANPDAEQDRIEHEGELHLGEFSVPCFVTASGERLIAARKMQEVLKVVEDDPEDQPGVQRPGTRFRRFLTRRFFNSLISQEELQTLFTPVRKLYKGQVINGYKADSLTKFCELMMQAKDRGLLSTERQYIVASQAKVLYDAFAKIGLAALIDEATGYQRVRPKDALQRYLEMLVRKELAIWAKKFPDEFYENIYKLRGWEWPGMGKNRYSVVAHYTRDLIYERMAPGLLKELEDKSPKDDKGNRGNKLHQWLTGEIGDPMLASHMQSILTLQRLAIANGWGWKKFMTMVDQVLHKKGQTLELPGMMLDEESPDL